METADLIDRLTKHKTLAGAPREELEWLALHGTVQEFEEGEMLSSKSERVNALYILLSGRIAMFVDRGGAGTHKAMEWEAGDVTGVLPYSRLTTPPGDTFAQTATGVLAVDREHILEMTRECPEVTSILVHTMLDRARFFTSSALHDEKMVSLGKLSAGLAHELNNPASAIERNAALLRRRVEEAEQAARRLGASRLSDEQLAAVDAAREACEAAPVRGVRSPIEEAERETAIAEWLKAHAVDLELADSLAETTVSLELLDQLAEEVESPALGTALQWTAAGCAVRGLTEEIQDAALRIAGLVMAIKGFTHMDQSLAAQPVDLAKGLDDTVAVLRSKARGKSVSVVVEVPPNLPEVCGFVGELNQVWGNLIDNALDAVPESGRVEISAACEGSRVAVRITDNGEGIPPDVRERIFDPFFTTKPVGKGTGLGLDIVRRLVLHNDGEVRVESEPGRTQFEVFLPIAGSGEGTGR